ncbi:conserved membrane hypothetical protein [Flavobacterium sp. 9AF]|nr:conserved membrane hypothetical protein [Flavobacterium sp. 9AF]
MLTLLFLYIVCLFLTTCNAIVLGMKYSFRTQNYLAIYLFVTFFLETYGFVKTCLQEQDFAIYFNLYSIFSILFFCFYFSKIFFINLKKILFITTFIILLYIFIFIDFLSTDFVISLGLIVAIFYIFNSLLWFNQKFKLPVKDKITNDPNFWIATALLLWSTYIIFRISPMYLFQKEDSYFLAILKKISSVVNIIMYSLFFIGLEKYKYLIKK